MSTQLQRLDAGRLRGFLDGRWGWVRDEVRREIGEFDQLRPAYGLTVDVYRERIFDQLKVLSGTVGTRLLFPKEYGGEGDLGAAITGFEMLALIDPSLMTKAGVQFGLFGGAVLHLGNEEQKKSLLPQVMSTQTLGCFAMTETGHGSDVQSIRTTATYDPERQEFVINTPDEDARKDYIGNAARDGRLAAVFAQLVTQGKSHGVHCFLVPIRDDQGRDCPGVRLEDCGHKAGLNGVDNGRIWFHQVRVPRTALLDRYGSVAEDGTYSSPIENETRRFFTMLGTLVQGRISVAGGALAASKLALLIAIRYANVRRQFRPPGTEQEIVLLDYRQHQRRLLPLLATTYAMHFAQEALVATLHDIFTSENWDDRERRRLESLAAGVKATGTWHAMKVLQTAREACGGAGYLSVNRIAGLRDDVDVFTTFEGDNTVLLQLVAKGLLTDYKDDFGSLDTLGMVRFVADQVVGAVVEFTAARSLKNFITDTVRRDDDRQIFDREYQLDLFAWREKHVIDALARRLRKGLGASKDPFDAFNQVQDHMLAAAQAHVDRIVVERFADAIERCRDEGLKAMLAKLMDLHVLSLVERERGWFLEHGQLTAARAKAVTAAVNSLCAELRPFAGGLVEAFGIPDELLQAPIALGEEARRQEAKAAAPTD